MKTNVLQCNSPVTATIDNTMSMLQSLKDRSDLVLNALAYAEGTHTFDDVIGMVMSGRLTWWPLKNSFLLLEIVEYPQKKYLHVFLAGGDLSEIKTTNDSLKAAAKDLGCAGVTLAGRRGWIKALKDIGWRESCTTVMTDL